MLARECPYDPSRLMGRQIHYLVPDSDSQLEATQEWKEGEEEEEEEITLNGSVRAARKCQNVVNIPEPQQRSMSIARVRPIDDTALCQTQASSACFSMLVLDPGWG
ncbi:hypothetical protein AJ78_00370 [Emergomyces pasteurianus Ep9510]|uniref:Uncharacterized protein n=1 Tax=Emergomyces pasteurianus Ep9510 TaxID=1447872 RepID=A0A1J9QTW3_9EURO|nr:hypothetical protein AJ78_00370 [Emergomyces pasteurianus Ep9510]